MTENTKSHVWIVIADYWREREEFVEAVFAKEVDAHAYCTDIMNKQKRSKKAVYPTLRIDQHELR